MKCSPINFPYRSFHRHYEENASAEDLKNLSNIYYSRDIVPKFRQYYKELACNLKLSDPNEIHSHYEMMKFCSAMANIPKMIYERNAEEAPDDILSFYRKLAEGNSAALDKSPKDIENTIRYICQYPLQTICSLIYNAEHLEEYIPFFLDDNAPLPEYPMVEVREAESFESRLLEELEGLKLAFAIMGKWRNMAQIVETEDGEFDNFADDLDIAFENYVRCYDLIGDDEIWRITFDLRKQWFNYLCGLDVLNGFDIERSLAGMNSCFCQLPPALYKLECRRYQEISKIRGVIFGRPIEKKTT